MNVSFVQKSFEKFRRKKFAEILRRIVGLIVRIDCTKDTLTFVEELNEVSINNKL